MKKLSVLIGTLVMMGMTVPIQSFADIYRLHILDCTASMRASHNTSTRFNEALFKLRNNITITSGVYDALWKIDGDNSGEVVSFTEDKSKINAAIDAEEASGAHGAHTDLADVLCDAMSALENAGQADDIKFLFLVTDGEENSSGEFNPATECADSIDHDNPNTLPFEVNALEVFPDGVVNTTERESWAPENSIIPERYEGRVYQHTNNKNYYWAAGVKPSTWEWNMFYRVSQGPGSIPVDKTQNKQYPASGALTDVIFNVINFYTDVVPPKSSLMADDTKASMSYDPTVETAAEEIKAQTEATRFAVSALAPMTSAYEQSELDCATFAGLAELTGGKFIAAPSSQTVPITGDLDGDGDVDEADLRAVLTWFGRPVDEYNQPSIDADLLNEGFINNLDISIIRSNWTDNNKCPPIVGDTDYNWCVDKSDLNKIWRWYGRTPASGNQEFHHADLNGDGFVNRDDVNLYYEHEGEGC